MKFTGVMILGVKLLLSMQLVHTECFSREEQNHRNTAVKKAAAAIIAPQIAANTIDDLIQTSNRHPSQVPPST